MGSDSPQLRNGRSILDSHSDAVAFASVGGQSSDHDASSAEPHRADRNRFKPAARSMLNDRGFGDGAAPFCHLLDLVGSAHVAPQRDGEPARAARLAPTHEKRRHDFSRTAAFALEPNRYVTIP